MIQSHLSDSARYESLHPLFKAAFDYIKNNDLLHAPAERIELCGSKLFINVSDATLLMPHEQKLEVHRRYIDIHVPLSQAEIIGWTHISRLETPVNPFDEEADFALYDAVPTTYNLVKPGEFLIVYPEDAHAPIIGKGTLRKLIIKVEVV